MSIGYLVLIVNGDDDMMVFISNLLDFVDWLFDVMLCIYFDVGYGGIF